MPIWRPIPRLGGRRKRVCRDCALILDQQPTLEDEMRAIGQVDRAVNTRRLAAVRSSSSFAPPADVADVAEDDGHPLASVEARSA